MPNFKINLKTVMQSKNVTAEKMARDLDVTNATVFNWRLGNGLKSENVKRICEYLQCTPNDIFLSSE